MLWRSASKRLLAAVGVWDHVKANTQPMLEIKVSDGHAGEGIAPFFMHFDHAEIEEGPMGFMLEDRFLYRGFLEAMDAQPLIQRIDGDAVVGQEVTASGVTAQLQSGKSLTAKVLIGCDGTRKWCGLTRWHQAHRLGI